MSDAADFTDDRVLVAALCRGDDAAFAWLVDRYSPPLLRLARSYVSTSASADEAMQETWVAVITGIDRFEHRSSVKTWIYRILMNIARSKGVKEHRSVPFTSLEQELDAPERAVDPGRFRTKGWWPGHWAAPPVPWDESPEHRLLSRETYAIVATAIEDLPPTQQTVIRLRDLEGWEPDEVCNALEISETNQRVLLHRARSKVRGALELHFEGTQR